MANRSSNSLIKSPVCRSCSGLICGSIVPMYCKPRITTTPTSACAVQNGIQIDTPGYFQVLDYALASMGNIPFTTPAPSPAASPATAPPEPETAKPMPQSPSDDSYAPHIASAPPSRSEYAGSMPPAEASARVTLSAAEREVAALAGVDEVTYAKNKLKLLQMKKAGLIRD